MNPLKKLIRFINALLEVQGQDSDDVRRRKLLNIILFSLFVLTFLGLLLSMAIEFLWAEELHMKPGENTELYFWILGVMGACSIFYYANRKLSNGLTGFIFLVFLTIIFAFSDETAELVDGRSLYVFTIPIILSSMLVRPYFSFVFAGLCVLELYVLAISADITPQPLPYFAFIFLALLSWLSATAMENAIKELRELNLQLDLRVAERTQDLLEANTQLQREIIEREQAEETVRQYADIVNTMQVGMYIVRADGLRKKNNLKIVAANPAALVFSGKTIEESIGQPIYQAGNVFGAKNFSQKCLAVIKTGVPTELESLIKDPDDELREAYNVKILPLTQDSVGILFENIIEKKLAEEQLRLFNTQLEKRVQQRTIELKTANKELESFSYTVSHDLRSPLRAIDGYSHILLDDFSDDLSVPARIFLDKIIRGVGQMAALIDGLLDFSRTSRAEIRRQNVALNEVVSEAWQVVTATPQPQQKIDFQCGQLPPCFADRTLIRQVFINLLSNAVKYSRHRESAQIQVDFLLDNKEIIYFVRDNGVGFDMKYSHKLFGVFQRLHHSDEFEGTGIGLATSHRIITRHGGKIWAEAQPDNGATFYFTIGTQNSSP